MKKRILPLAVACAVLLSGCSALLERSYGGVEPYAERYWDTGAEDTLRAENYQDLVNSLLMLVEQRAEAGAIRCYGEAMGYTRAWDAVREVCRETMLGSYLLDGLTYRYDSSSAGGYCTLTCELSYREDAEDPDAMMTLSDSQSLVDLLRLAVREGHARLTARFAYDMPREAVTDAVESLWQELCQDELDQQAPEDSGEEDPGETGEPGEEGEDGEAPEPEGAEAPDAETQPPEVEAPEDAEPSPEPEDETAPEPEPDKAPEDGEAQDGEQSPDAAPGEEGDETPTEAPDAGEEPPPPEYPPCPWTVKFYPDMETAELAEIWLERP